MSAELIARYRAEANRHAQLAEMLAVAVVTREVSEPGGREYALSDLRMHNRCKERYRRQADALEAAPGAWVRCGPAWLD